LYYPARPQSEAELEAAASDARLDPQDPGFRCFEVHAGVFTPLLQRFVIAASNASASASSASSPAAATPSSANAVQEFFDAIPISLRNEVTYSILLGSFSARGAIDQAVALLAQLEHAVQQGFARLDEAAALALLRRLERQSKEAPDMVAAARTLLPLTQAIWALLLRQSAVAAKNSDSFSTSAAAGAVTPTVTAAMLRAMSLAGLDQASRLVTVLRGACAAEGEEERNGFSAAERQQQQHTVPALYADAECFLFVLAQLRRASAALETNVDDDKIGANANAAVASGGGGSLRHQAALVEQMARDRHAAAAALVHSLINTSIVEGGRASRVVAAASNSERALRLPAHLNEAVARFAPMTTTTVESPSRYSLSLPSATTAVSASASTPAAAAAAAASLPSLSPEEALLVRRDPWRLNAFRVAAGLADPSSPVSRLLDSLRRMRERGHPFTIERVHEATQGFTDEHLSVPSLEELLKYYALIPPTAPPAASSKKAEDDAAPTASRSKSSSAKKSFIVDESVHAALPQAAFNRVVKGQALVPRSSTYAALMAALARHWQPRQLGSILRARTAMLHYKPPPTLGASRTKQAKKTAAAAADTHAAAADVEAGAIAADKEDSTAEAATTTATEPASVGLRFTADDFRIMRPAMHARKETAKLLSQWQEEDSPLSVLSDALAHPALSSLSAEKRLQPGYLAEQYYAHLVRGRGDDAQAVLRAAEAVVPVVTLPVLYNWMRNLLRVAPKLAALQQQRTTSQQAQQEQSEFMPSAAATPTTTDGGASRIPSAWEEVQRLWGLMQRAQLTPNSNLARVTFEVGMVSDRTWRAQAAWGALHDDMLAGRGAFGHAQPLIMEPEHYAALIRRAQHMHFPAAVRAWTARAKEADKRRKQLQQLQDKFVLLPQHSASSHADDTGAAARLSILTPSDSSSAKTASVRAGESVNEVDMEGANEGGEGSSTSSAAASTTSASAAASGTSQWLRAAAPHGHPAEPAAIAHATRIKAADEAAAAETAATEMGEGASSAP
jgi:hypothetical protein